MNKDDNQVLEHQPVDSHSSYASSGVDYEVLDEMKRLFVVSASSTSANPEERGGLVLEKSRGEPATVVEVRGVSLGFVLECLGTKSMIARAYEDETGIDRFESIGYDTVASIVNDCCCVGALPVVVNAYFATGSAEFYRGTRHRSLIAGWKRACDDAGATWGGGESPTLTGLVVPEGIDLAGAAIGVVPQGQPVILGEELRAGDEIVFIASSGMHTNGASLARQIAARLDSGLSTRLSSGKTLGEALLEPSLIYVRLVETLLGQGAPVHYMSHVTGHGLRKIMRARNEFSYRVDSLPPVPEVLSFLCEQAGLSAREAYATFNMGVGFALYVERGAGSAVVDVATSLGYSATAGGSLHDGPRSVIVEPIGETYLDDELKLL